MTLGKESFLDIACALVVLGSFLSLGCLPLALFSKNFDQGFPPSIMCHHRL